MSKSCTNLVDLAKGENFPSLENLKLERSMSAPGVLSDFDLDSSVSSEVPNRFIVVSNQLPIIATCITNEDGGRFWEFSWDENSIYGNIKDGIPETNEVFYVGTLRADVYPHEYDDVSQTLLDNFKCVAVFVPIVKWRNYYNGFCKQYLWPIFHYKLPFLDNHGGRYNSDLWNAYVSVNREFSEKVLEAISNSDDYVWIHDYHLMMLPTFLRDHLCRFKIGFFLHSPFPCSEIYKCIPVRNKILKGLLSADVIGFHTFDYARHFLSCCSRMFGLDYQLKRGYIYLEYNGRNIRIKIMPSGIHVGQRESLLSHPDTRLAVQELERRFQGKTVLLGVDDLDVFKGINFKVLAMEEMLRSHPSWQGRAVLVQILNPARTQSQEVVAINFEIRSICQRINNEFGSPGYLPIVLIDNALSLSQKAAYYAISEVAIVTPVRDGMNLIPYEYIVSRDNSAKKSMLVVSEFIGCSPSLSGAIRVNPWNIVATSEAIYKAISASDLHKETVHMKHYQYIKTHDVANWSNSFFKDLVETCIDHSSKRCIKRGLLLESTAVLFDQGFRKLDADIVENAYKKSHNRVVLLDYDGTIMPMINKRPTESVINMINQLCSDPKNTVFIISGRAKENLGRWFGACQKLAIAAEHGYFIRWAGDEEWETCGCCNDVKWMEIAEPIMNLYTETIDGSYIEKKETAMVWHYEVADKDFGSDQANELLGHLESVLVNEPVAVKHGQYIVEVKPQGVNKGIVATKVFDLLAENGKRADFVLGIGNDRSDEDMFVAIGEAVKKGLITNDNSVFACTVGEKPSSAEYYFDEAENVVTLLEKLG